MCFGATCVHMFTLVVDVVVALTYLGYRYEGLRYDDFNEIITEIRAQLTKEVGPVKTRKASILYEHWVIEAGGHLKGHDEPLLHDGKYDEFDEKHPDEGTEMEVDDEKEVVPLRLLKRSDEEQMQKLFKLLRESPHVIDYYMKEMVFPTFMRHQTVKLSASGQEIGGDILFKRRVGFSGTPSSLLPLEMGQTQYEKGADGLMLCVMNDPKTVSYEVTANDWTVHGLLRKIAKQPSEAKYSALLDTGALITGMSNLEVATFLLDEGMEWCDGVVFLDEQDRKMVLVRSTRRVVELDQCGIPPTMLFALYDQIHTTGTDLPFLSTFNALCLVIRNT